MIGLPLAFRLFDPFFSETTKTTFCSTIWTDHTKDSIQQTYFLLKYLIKNNYIAELPQTIITSNYYSIWNEYRQRFPMLHLFEKNNFPVTFISTIFFFISYVDWLWSNFLVRFKFLDSWHVLFYIQEAILQFTGFSSIQTLERFFLRTVHIFSPNSWT